MDPNNFVGPSSSGYDVYVNGQKVGSFSDLNSAQNAFNSAQGGGTGGGNGAGSISSQHRQDLQTAGYGDWNNPNLTEADYNRISANAQAGGGTDTSGSLQKLLDAIATGDTQKFQEAIREFNVSAAEKQREFDAAQAAQQGQFNTSTTEGARQFSLANALKQQEDYSGLASDLLKTASSLRGPQDYYQYQKMLSGGRDLMSQLYGNQPNAAFSQVQGKLTPTSLTDVMTQLGFKQAPQTPTSFYDPVSKGLITPPVMDTGGKVKGPDGAHVLAILKVGEKVTPAGKSSKSSSSEGSKKPLLTWKGLPIFDAGGVVSLPDPFGTGPKFPGTLSTIPTIKRGPTLLPSGAKPIPSVPVPPVAPTTAPRPYQINPAVYDTLGATGQSLLRSLAEDEGWDWNDYLGQINAQRPQGIAPAMSIYEYFMSPGAHSSTEGMAGAY